jgi:hypothetical protein
MSAAYGPSMLEPCEHWVRIAAAREAVLASPPEMIVEVAASSASIDLRDKGRAYCRNGVSEYLVWPVAEARLEWFWLEEDDYCPQLPDAHGVLHSRIFPGLQLPVARLLAGDIAKVLATLTGPEPPNKKPPETIVKSEQPTRGVAGRGQ